MYVVSQSGRKHSFFEVIIIDCEYFINFNNYTNDSKRAGLANSTTPVDRILLSLKCGKSDSPESYYLHHFVAEFILIT